MRYLSTRTSFKAESASWLCHSTHPFSHRQSIRSYASRRAPHSSTLTPVPNTRTSTLMIVARTSRGCL
jgi:hypothetical protein